MGRTYRIVVGVDGSDGSRRALRWALHEAARRHGAVQAVIAWRGHGDDPDQQPPSPTTKDAAAEILAREVNDALCLVEPQPSVALEATEGRAPRVLTQAARDADLLVLGSHGNGRAHHATLGSVSEEAIRYAACPVVVVPVPHPERVFLAEEPAVRG